MDFNFSRTNCSGKRKDQGGRDLFTGRSVREDVQAIIDKWNSYMWLPKCVGTDRQARLIREALQRPFFKNNWEASFAVMAKSCKFLILKMKPQIRLDWWLIPDNFDKIMEGLYIDDDKKNKIESNHKTTVNDEGDEIIQ